jgi:hypothetical protein
MLLDQNEMFVPKLADGDRRINPRRVGARAFS